MNDQPLLSLRDVRHAFGSGSTRKEVLHGVDLRLAPGEIVILTGPSGSGKTTILTLAGALRTVQSGSVSTFGLELAGATAATQLEVRRRIGFIFQQPNLLESLTAAQNVQLALAWKGPVPSTEARRRALEQLDDVGLVDCADRHPAQLSGGQRQRVAIARALVVRPQLILADEPPSALDRHTGREVVDLLQELARREKCAILLVTHDHRILDIADRQLALEDGKLVSLARAASQQTHLTLEGLNRASRAVDLTRDIAEFDEPQLVRFLAESTDDLAQLCRVIELARGHLASSLLDRLLVAATHKAGQWLEAERVTLFLVDNPARKLRSRVAQSDGSELLTLEVDLDSGIAGHTARTGEKILLADAYQSPFFNPEVDHRTGYRTRSVLCLPLFDETRTVFAVAQALNKRGGQSFTPEDARRFEQFLEPLGGLLQQVLATENTLRTSSHAPPAGVQLRVVGT